MKIQNFEDAILKVQPFLKTYLEEQGINTSKLFCCINPSHPDKTPSCGIVPGEEVLFRCFGCGVVGNIFKARYYLENKPLAGQGFIQENLIPLAEKYSISLETTPLTEDDLYELDTYKAYLLAHDLIISSKLSEMAQQAIKDRGWSTELCRQYGTGGVSSFKDFREHLKKYGFTAQFLDDIDLGRKEIFDSDRIIFTIKDHHGRPVGFASRNLSYTEDKTNGTKYVNQKTTGAKCNIYKKSTRLFGFDQLLKKHPKKSDPVYIFEGYGDVLTAAQYGFTNCVAIGGTSFTVDQLQLLKDHGYYNLVLCLDGDEPGQKRTAELLDTTLGGHKDIRLSICIIPNEEDPDDFIKNHGIKDFRELKIWTAFEWRLLQYIEGTDPEIICKTMVPLIVNESSSVAQEKMIKALCLNTGISQKSIAADVQKLQNSHEAEKDRSRRNILDKLARNIQKDSLNAELIMDEAKQALYDLDTRYNMDTFSEDADLTFLDQQKQLEESKTGEFSGFVLGNDLQAFQDSLCGEWQKDVFLVFGGKANAGKTSFLCKIGFEIANRIKDNDALVIYHTIDDTKAQIIPKFICVAEGSKKLSINAVKDPKYWTKVDPNTFNRRDSGYDSLRKLMSEGRLIIKDANDGGSIAYADNLIQRFKERFPNRKVVYILDNFHKLTDYKNLSDERVRFKALSSAVKGLATKHHICIMSTVEYTKLGKGEKPNNSNIAETVQIEYDANLICHLYNDLHEFGNAATHYHLDFDSSGTEAKKFPRIEVIFGKSKITDFKGSIWLDFFPTSSDWAWVDPEEAFALEKEAIEDSRSGYRPSKYKANSFELIPVNS